MEGYPNLAHFMGQHSEFSILRRFSRLNMQNLLYLQAEIVHLEADLDQTALKDQTSTHPQKAAYSRDWWSLANSKNEGDETQWRKVLEVRGKLKEYRAFNACGRSDDYLSKQVFLSHLPRPSPYDLEFLRTYLRDPRSLNHPILGLDRNVWDRSLNDSDLVTLSRSMNTDTLSQFVRNIVIPFFHNVLGARFKDPIPLAPSSGIACYSDKHINSAVNLIGTVGSSLFPILAIVVLYNIQEMRIRLGCIAGFTGLFSLALGLVTHGSRVEIFAATTAFAAVLVVFVGSNSCIRSQ